MKTLPQGSEDFRRKNPHLWQSKGEGVYRRPQDNALYIDATYAKQNPSSVAPVCTTQPEQNEVHALDQGKKTRRGGKGAGVVRVTIIRCAARPLDYGDNLNFSYKAVKDAIALAFGTTDSDRGIEWAFRQIIVPKESEGTILKFDLL